MDEYDSDIRNHKQTSLEETTPETNRILIESAWVCPYETPIPPEPPDKYNKESGDVTNDNIDVHDDGDDADRVGLLYKYHLNLQAKRLNRRGATDQVITHINGLSDGNDWTYNNDDGSWAVPEIDIPQFLNTTLECSYDLTFSMDNISVTKCKKPPTKRQTQIVQMIQSDTGANANITSDLSILEDVQWVQPVQCKSAKKGTTIEIQAIGKYVLCGTNLKINMYFCLEAHGTIISPTAIVQQHSQLFIGYQKHTNLDRSIRSITLIPREQHKDVSRTVIPLYVENDLWYHTLSHTNAGNETDMYCQPCGTGAPPPTFMINRLSDAAKWELWHQRMTHVGTRTMEQTHKHTDGVPMLLGNVFYRCPSCMPGKLCTKLPGYHHTLGTDRPAHHHTSPEHNDDTNSDDVVDNVYLPDALPGQHFHMDFGFAQGSEFKMETKKSKGPTITSINGKNSYCLVIDRATQHIWVFLSNSKEPPVEPICMILKKFGSRSTTHRMVQTDQDEGLGRSLDFKAMLKNEDFTLELTGTNSLKQNSHAERPRRDLAQMMRCMLHAAELGPEFWPYALVHAVYIKNQIPHSSINTTPFQASTGKRANLSRLRIFGSRVYARKTGNHPAKLDHHASEGIFLSFTATDSNVYYLDDKTGTIKIVQHVVFDEAHMTRPAGYAPLAAQALQQLGYYVHESWVKETKTDADRPNEEKMQVKKITNTAQPPRCTTPESIGYDLFLDKAEVKIPPGETAMLPIRIAAQAPSGTYLRVAPRSGLTIKKHVHTLAGVVDPDYTGNITVIMYNFSTEEQVFKRGDKIAQMILESAKTPDLQVVENLTATQRGDSGFGSADADPIAVEYPPTVQPAIKTHEMPKQKEPPDYANLDSILGTDINLIFRVPYDIQLSDSPFDNQTFQTISTFDTDPNLGFDIHTCQKFGLPPVNNCKKSTPCAKLP